MFIHVTTQLFVCVHVQGVSSLIPRPTYLHGYETRVCPCVAVSYSLCSCPASAGCSIPHWWWVPVVAPMIGGVIAALFYWALIEAHHPTSDSRKSADDKSPLLNEGNINTPEERLSPTRDMEY